MNRTSAVWILTTLHAFGAFLAAVELYGTRIHLYRCLLLGDSMWWDSNGRLCIGDSETWDAYWNGIEWVVTG